MTSKGKTLGEGLAVRSSGQKNKRAHFPFFSRRLHFKELLSPVPYAGSISIPTGQWSEPATSPRMKARLRRGRSEEEIRK